MAKKNTSSEGGQTKGRLQSLDALRGFDMLFIMGGAGLVTGLATLIPCPFTEALAGQMHHVEWHGLAFMDTIFPLFLFIAGISFPFSLEKQRKSGKSRAAIYKKIFRRGLILVLLGILYNGFLVNLNFAEQRYASVLGRIGLAWMFGALIFMNTRWKARAVIIGVILVGYWLVMGFVPAPDGGGADIFSAEGSIAGWVDRNFLPGALYQGNIDPEGLLGLIPAIATALMGMMTGEFVKTKREGLTESRKVVYMILAGLAMLAVGLLWSTVFPINKKLWTSTFVLVVGAYSLIMLALFYWIIDVRNHRRWTFFFVVIGMNSITIYLAQRFIRFWDTTWEVGNGIKNLLPEPAQPLFNSMVYVTLCWLFLYFLYKKKVFLKV